MGYDLSKRIGDLKTQVQASEHRRWGFARCLVLSFVALVGIYLVLSPLFTDIELASKSSANLSPNDRWKEETAALFEARRVWLERSPLSLLGTDSTYTAFGVAVVATFLPDELKNEQDASAEEPSADAILTESLFDFMGWKVWISQVIIGTLLRFGFILIAFWPFWLLACLCGYIFLKKRMLPKTANDILGICDRKVSPFYSGIFAPLASNQSISATDLSCPGLACPAQAKRQNALIHPLATCLKRFRALNETNIGLIQIILAHRDYPRVVAEERTDEDSETKEKLSDADFADSFFVTNDEGTLEESAREGLRAVLEAHEKLRRYYRSSSSHTSADQTIDEEFERHRTATDELASSASSPLAAILIRALTPLRAEALSRLSADIVAAAYLSIEAGKALVYQRQHNQFARISRFPNLQARAVINSLEGFHREYAGDSRLMVRQAIICSRRHGDFGRPFLPYRMPPESRALRDWLEILYANPNLREDTGHLVELDSHIEELHVKWRDAFAEHVRKNTIASSNETPKDSSGKFSIGFAYKSVVLMPLRVVSNLALRDLGDKRCKHIMELLVKTRKFQTTISISARLPGFRRQAVEAWTGGIEAGKISSVIATRDRGRDLLDRWLIVRRMLTRYNWLSTRVGDDGVPIDGMVQAIIRDPSSGSPVGLDALVPLRQRRIAEILGKRWESEFYEDSPAQEIVEIYIDPEEFSEALKQKRPLGMGGASSSQPPSDVGSAIVH